MIRLTAEQFLEKIKQASELEPRQDVVMDFFRVEPKLVTLGDGDEETTDYFGPDPTQTPYPDYLYFLVRIDFAHGTQFLQYYLRDRIGM
jgi:hypothetical protein